MSRLLLTRPPVFECKAGHLLCSACRSGAGEGHCRRCGRVTTCAHCSVVDAYVDAARVPCPYRAYGCDSSVVYHDTAAHQSACVHAPCRCSEPGCPFAASPALLREHLAADHSWRVERVQSYGKPHTLRVSASERRLVLAVEGDGRHQLFIMSVRTRGAAVAVSVACVRASAGAVPQFKCMLWAEAPPRPGAPTRRLTMEADVGSCAEPGGASLDEGMWLDLMPAMLHGPSKEMNLRVRIDPAARSANASGAGK